jgi:hypothetical protein
MDDETTGKLPPEDEELTRVTPPDDDATRVMPPADDEATRVMPGEDAGATRVMPAAGEAQPPPPPQPTLLMTHGRQPSDRGVPWWVWVLVVLAIVAAAAALWYFYLRPTSPDTSAGDVFVGNWSPRDGTGGGLVIKQDGDQFKVTQYDPELQPAGSTTATLENDQLTLTVQASAVGLTDVTGTIQGTLTHNDDDTLTLQFSSGSLQLKPIEYVRVDVLLPGTPSPSPTPTTASPSPSPTTASPSPTASPTASPSASADQQVQDNIAKLQVGIVAWAADNNNLYPAPQDVVEGGGISQYVSPWPTDPFTGQPMVPGTSPGSYVYEQLSGGQGYRLTGYLGNGLTYTVP